MSRYRPRSADGPRLNRIEFAVSDGELAMMRRWAKAFGKTDVAFIWLCVEAICAQVESGENQISPVDWGA